LLAPDIADAKIRESDVRESAGMGAGGIFTMSKFRALCAITRARDKHDDQPD
jgi:hypothetical protein